MKMALELSIVDQGKAVRQFIDHFNTIGHLNSENQNITHKTATKFLYARKFDVSRAISLYNQHEELRLKEGLLNINPEVEPLRSELQTGKFTILGTRDNSGSAIALFTANKHSPLDVTHTTTLQGIVFQLDCALKDIETQKAGLVFIYDMSDSKYSNFDYDLSHKILTLLKGGYPARLKKVLIVTAPLWFKAPFKILRLFVREKLRERVFTVSLSTLSLHVPHRALPKHLGGSLEIDHNKWLLSCYELMWSSENDTLANLEKVSNYCKQNSIRTTNPTAEINNKVSEVTTTNRMNDNLENTEHCKNFINDCSVLNKNNECGSENVIAERCLDNLLSRASSGLGDDNSLEGDSQSIEQIVQMLKKRGRQGLINDYTEIRNRAPEGTFIHAKMRHNLSKNRYTDVLCFDHSRVILSHEDNDENSDYINANYVNGYKQKDAYISTQGPLPKTSPDFWRMIWEQQCCVIVMTTRVLERGRIKCGQYWEPSEKSSLEFGNFQIRTISMEINEDYTVASLELKNLKTEQIRSVSHWQFTSWPDYGVPSSATAVLNFLEKVRKQQSQMTKELGDTWTGHYRGPPIVVHCSAGIGRTGTFITLDICISSLEDIGTADIRGTVEKIRSQRAYSIQMPDQYIFCHLALIEYALSRGMIKYANLKDFDDHEDESESN